MTIALAVIAGLVVCWAAITAIVVRAIAVRRQVVASLGGRGDVELLETVANFLGKESKGAAQLRGTGCLGLNAKELVFVMWLPRREIRIRRRDVVQIDTPRTFLGTWKGVRLLQVTWRTGAGDTDSAAWVVRKRDDWVRSLAPAAHTGV